MFPPHPFFRKGRPCALFTPVIFVLCLAVGAALFTGCSNPAGADPIPAAYVVKANGTTAEVTSTAISFTFSRAVSLAAADITVTNGTGSVSKGNLGGGGASWSLTLATVTAPGTVTVSIAKEGIESDAKTVTVHKDGTVTPFTLPAGLNGYFQSLPYMGLASMAYYDDGFVVDVAAKTFYYYQDSTFTTKWGGPVVATVSEGDATVMIVKIDEVTGSWYVPPTVGNYFAAAYKNLTHYAVSSCTAFKMAAGDNDGADTIEEAISEYTIANGYFDPLSTTLYYPHTVSAVTLAPLQGKWVTEDFTGDPDYFIQISGTKLTEWLDDGDDVYDTEDDESMLAELGDIVDHTDTSAASGVLYLRGIASGAGSIADKYLAVAWKDKTDSSISFSTFFGPDSEGYTTLAACKAANPGADGANFKDGFYDYAK
ncbi:MAG: hypothetical protein LBQ55_09905 [Treponema sp.]|jgi:hypothetical protein|nr:hypothetical protein [Treponema sp.]